MKHIRILLAASALLAAAPASAQDVVKMTIGQRGDWDTAVPHLGEKAGIFKKHGLTLEMLYTSGSGETVQPVEGAQVGAELGGERDANAPAVSAADVRTGSTSGQPRANRRRSVLSGRTANHRPSPHCNDCPTGSRAVTGVRY